MAMICAAAFFLVVPVLVLAENPAGTAQPVGPKRLEGRWLRPDGGYILELNGIKKDGSLKAAYFNPGPINVARAGFKNLNGKLGVFVELRDVNYPGSLYELQYDPGTDRLKGTYFQAVEKRTFDIEFVRMNKP
jgi:hypothetical protein